MQNANDELWLYDQSAKLHHTQKHERYTDIYIHTYIYIYKHVRWSVYVQSENYCNIIYTLFNVI